MELPNLLINKRLFLLDYGFRNRCKIDEMKEEILATDHAALAILKKTGLDVVEAAQLAHELLQASKGRGNRWKRARECIRLGEEALVARGKPWRSGKPWMRPWRPGKIAGKEPGMISVISAGGC